MKIITKPTLALFLTLIISSCGEINDFACDTNHPSCSKITIHNESNSVGINTVTIEKHCASSWSGSEGKTIGPGKSKEFRVDPGDTYDVRVLYDNGTCDFEYDVEPPDDVTVYRTHFSCPAPCA